MRRLFSFTALGILALAATTFAAPAKSREPGHRSDRASRLRCQLRGGQARHSRDDVRPGLGRPRDAGQEDYSTSRPGQRCRSPGQGPLHQWRRHEARGSDRSVGPGGQGTGDGREEVDAGDRSWQADAEAVRVPGVGLGSCVRGGAWNLGQRDREGAAVSDRRTNRDVAAMGFHDCLDERQAKAKPSDRSAHIRPVQPAPDEGQSCGGMPAPVSLTVMTVPLLRVRQPLPVRRPPCTRRHSGSGWRGCRRRVRSALTSNAGHRGLDDNAALFGLVRV